MENPIKLARGNSKIHKALIWNITSRITCPGATELCKQICYAHNAEVLYPNRVPQSRESNFRISRMPNFRELMIEVIKGSKMKLVRIHESGDFYNQKYLDDWVAIIKANPDRKFWAYTKSWKLDFTKALKLKNLYLRYSIDATTTHFPSQKIPYAAVSDKMNDLFICPSANVKGHEIRCMRDCYFCVETRKGLTFKPHGVGAKKARLVADSLRQSNSEKIGAEHILSKL